MARLTLNVEIDPGCDRNGFSAVMIRVHKQGELPKRLLTRVRIEHKEKHWAALVRKKRKAAGATTKSTWGRWVVAHPDSDALNAKIESEYNRIKKLVEGWQQDELQQNPDLTDSTLTPQQIHERYNARLTDNFFDLAERALEESKAKSFRTYTARVSAVNAFAKYAGEDVLLQQVTVAYIERFQKYLETHKSEKTGKRLASSSINQYMEALNTVHVDMLRLKGHSTSKARLLSPWSEVDKLKARSAYRAKLSEKQIDTLQVSMPESRRRRVKPEESFSVWMLSHLLAGMRFTDVMLLRYSMFDINPEGVPTDLHYQMNKTGATVKIPVFDEARELLMRWWKHDHNPTDYVLPYLDPTASYAAYLTRDELYAAPFAVREELDSRIHYWNRTFNTVLAEIEEHGKLRQKLRFHNARHSFADLARRVMQEDNSITILDITRMLGQSDYRMVMVYIEEMENQDADKPMTAIFKRTTKRADAA